MGNRAAMLIDLTKFIFLPRVSMRFCRCVGLAAASAGAAAVSMAASGVTALACVDVEAAVASVPSEAVTEPVAPFGMTSHERVVGAPPLRLAQIDAGGNALYNSQCISCHGPEGRGVPGLGAALAESAFISTRSAEELVAFLRAGRMPDDPDSVSGRPMPGFAWVSEDELAGLVDYLKGL